MYQKIETARGVAEVETIGTGAPVLVLHGSPGGIDGAQAMSRFLDTGDFKLILLSRPGYLGTALHPLETSIDHEAQFIIAVLDAIGIERTSVLAWSGGGPSAYRFAAKYPERISALVSIAAVSFCWIAPQPTAGQRLLFGTELGGHLVHFLTKYSPKQVVAGALEGEGSVRGKELQQLIEQTMSSPDQRQLVLEIARTVNTVGSRRSGWQNDICNFANIETLELDKIKCPVLLVHGDADTDAPLEHSQFAHQRVRDSELIIMEGGTHLAFYAHARATEVQERARAWILRFAAV